MNDHKDHKDHHHKDHHPQGDEETPFDEAFLDQDPKGFFSQALDHMFEESSSTLVVMNQQQQQHQNSVVDANDDYKDEREEEDMYSELVLRTPEPTCKFLCGLIGLVALGAVAIAVMGIKNKQLQEVKQSSFNGGSGSGSGLGIKEVLSENTQDLLGPLPVEQEQEEQDEALPTDFVLPNLLFVGAWRAGTSAVEHWLRDNHVCEGEVWDDEEEWRQKSVGFFSISERFEQGLEFYSNHFEHCKTDDSINDIVLDTTPRYFNVPARIHSFYKAVNYTLPKIMMVLREPISRELSYYNQVLFHFRSSSHPMQDWASFIAHPDDSTRAMTFDEYVTLNVLPAIQNGQGFGVYAPVLQEWIELFGADFRKDNILVLDYDELNNKEESALNRIKKFLGHNEFTGDLLQHIGSTHFEEKVEMPSCEIGVKLNDAFEPYNQQLYDLLQKYPGPNMEQRPFPHFRPPVCQSGEVLLPNLLFVGAMRSGTSALAKWLRDNNVCEAKVLDEDEVWRQQSVGFFSNPARFKKGLGFYAHHFDHCFDEGNDIILDTTPRYFSQCQRIHNFYQDVGYDQPKIMMVLREPIARELSFYNECFSMFQKAKDPTQEWFAFLGHPDDPKRAMTFDEYVEFHLLPEIESGEGWGLYANYLEGWFELFGDKHRQSKILVLSHQELVEKEETTLNRIKEFLGHQEFSNDLLLHGIKATEESPSSMTCKILAKLQDAFAPYNERLYRLLLDNPGPTMEQRPFPRFTPVACHEGGGDGEEGLPEEKNETEIQEKQAEWEYEEEEQEEQNGNTNPVEDYKEGEEELDEKEEEEVHNEVDESPLVGGGGGGTNPVEEYKEGEEELDEKEEEEVHNEVDESPLVGGGGGGGAGAEVVDENPLGEDDDKGEDQELDENPLGDDDYRL